MDINQPISLPSSGDPHDSVQQSTPAADNVDVNNLQINDDNNHDDSDSKQIDNEDHDNKDDDSEDHEDEDEEEDDESDFTFMCVGDTDSQSTEDFESGQIRPVFPLFDQTLLQNNDYSDEKRRLPMDVPVNNVFVESPRQSPSSGYGSTGGVAASISKESDSGKPEINIKSNSTGFSKLWRFRNEMNRSNSDGRDAYVFLNDKEASTSSNVDHSIGKEKVKVNEGGKSKVVKKGTKLKKSTASAHEVYLKQKGGQTEEERRKSYLPYRPGLMGFFTNVNGGLSKNVHPF